VSWLRAWVDLGNEPRVDAVHARPTAVGPDSASIRGGKRKEEEPGVGPLVFRLGRHANRPRMRPSSDER